MDALITFLTLVLKGAQSWEILDTHPRDLFPTVRDYKRARKVLNRALADVDAVDRIGDKPTVNRWVHVAYLAGLRDHLDLVVEMVAARRPHEAARMDAKYGVRTEDVAHEPVLNEQARRVRDGEVMRDSRGRIVSREVAEIFA